MKKKTHLQIGIFYSSDNPSIADSIKEDVIEACKYIGCSNVDDWKDCGEGWVLFESDDIEYLLYY